jgi:hypothetical protein
MAEETQDGQKTIVAFVVGLLIGGLLVWAFSGPTTNAPSVTMEEAEESESSEEQSENESSETDMDTVEITPVPELQVGDGAVSVEDQAASASIALDSATYPVSEGWIGVREYNNDQLGYILGVVRFSESQGLVPDAIELQRATSPGNRYAVVIFTEDGDFEFSLAQDVQIDTIFDTFVAQ